MLCISKDCIFYADFKYVYNITGQRSFEVKQKWRKVKLWSKMMKIAYDNQMVIKCISKDCIFYADFKYVYNITGQRSFEVKQKWRKVKLWSKMMKIAYDNQMVIKCISKDCIFYADFKYVYNLTGPRSFEVKKMTSKVKHRSNLTKTANDHSIIACDPLFERNLKTDYKFDTHMTVKDHLRSKK